MAQALMAVQAAGNLLLGAQAAGYRYGEQAAKQENADSSYACKISDAIEDALDRGFLAVYDVHGVHVLAPNCISRGKVLNPNAWLTSVPSVPFVPPAATSSRARIAIRYHAIAHGNQLIIPRDQISAFLIDNGIPILTATELEKRLSSSLSKSMPLIECTCVGQIGLSGKTAVNSLLGNESKGLAPGDIRFRIHIEQDFCIYEDNPEAFTDELKCTMLAAMGIDPKRLPNAKQDITVERVEPGSIWFWVKIGAALIVAATVFFAGARSGFRSQRPAPGNQGCYTREQPQTRARDNSEANQAPQDHPRGEHILRQPHVHDWEVLRPISSTSTSRSSYEEEYTRHPVQELRLENLPGGWQLIVTPADLSRCYLRDALFQVELGEYKTAERLKAFSDTVFSASGNMLGVVYKKVHPRENRKMVTIRTSQAEITVTSDHSICVPDCEGVRGVRHAGTLAKGDVIFCGRKQQKIEKIASFMHTVEVVELGFDPDDAVETVTAPRWGILTKGRCPDWRLSAFRAPGSYRPEKQQADGSRLRARSLEPQPSPPMSVCLMHTTHN